MDMSMKVTGKLEPLVKSQTFGDFINEGSLGYSKIDTEDFGKFLEESDKYFKKLENFIEKNVPDDWFVRLADIGALRAADLAGRDTGQLQDYGITGKASNGKVHFKAEATNLIGYDYAPAHHWGNENYPGTGFFHGTGDAADLGYLMVDYSMCEVMAGNEMPTFQKAYNAANALIERDRMPDLPGKVYMDQFFGKQGTHWERHWDYTPRAEERGQALEGYISQMADNPVDDYDFFGPTQTDIWGDDDFIYDD